MHNRYLLLALLILAICLSIGVCKFKFGYMENFTADEWSGAYVYTVPNRSGGTLSIKMRTISNDNLGTITLHSFQTVDGKTVSEQTWTVKAKLSASELYGGNACSNILITKTNDIDSDSALELINVKLADLNNNVIDLDKYLLQGGCCGEKMDTWAVNNNHEVFKRSSGDTTNPWCKVGDGYKFVKVTDDYVFGVKSGTQPTGRYIRTANDTNIYFELEGKKYYVTSCQMCDVNICASYETVTDDYMNSLTTGPNFNCSMLPSNYTNLAVCERPCNKNSKWTPIPGHFTNMAIDNNGWFGVNSKGETYYSQGSDIQKPSFSGPNGTSVKSTAFNDNYYYVINDNTSVWYRPRSSPAGQEGWKMMPDASATTLAVDNYSYWLVAASGPNVGKILTGTIDANTGVFSTPQHVPGSFNYLSMDNQYVYGINSASQIFRCTRPNSQNAGCLDQWEHIPGAAAQISSYTS